MQLVCLPNNLYEIRTKMTNNKNLQEESAISSFRDYFHSLGNESPKAAFRKRICNILGITRTTLYDKINNERFTKLEKERIAEEVGQPVELLFPEEVVC